MKARSAWAAGAVGVGLQQVEVLAPGLAPALLARGPDRPARPAAGRAPGSGRRRHQVGVDAQRRPQLLERLRRGAPAPAAPRRGWRAPRRSRGRAGRRGRSGPGPPAASSRPRATTPSPFQPSGRSGANSRACSKATSARSRVAGREVGVAAAQLLGGAGVDHRRGRGSRRRARGRSGESRRPTSPGAGWSRMVSTAIAPARATCRTLPTPPPLTARCSLLPAARRRGGASPSDSPWRRAVFERAGGAGLRLAAVTSCWLVGGLEADGPARLRVRGSAGPAAARTRSRPEARPALGAGPRALAAAWPALEAGLRLPGPPGRAGPDRRGCGPGWTGSPRRRALGRGGAGAGAGRAGAAAGLEAVVGLGYYP